MSAAYILQNCQHCSATKTYSAPNFLCSSDAELLRAPVRKVYSLLRQLCDMLQPPRRHQDPRETSGHDMLPWAINSPLVLAARRTYISVPILASYHLRPRESTSHIFWHSSKVLVHIHEYFAFAFRHSTDSALNCTQNKNELYFFIIFDHKCICI